MNTLQQAPSAVVSLGQLSLMPDASGVLFEPDHKLLIVSDLHLEKGSSLARRGALLPPYDTSETLHRLSSLIDRLSPKTLIALGDTWHDGNGPFRMKDHDQESFALLRKKTDWILIAGNHDPDLPHHLATRVVNEIEIGGVIFRHEPRALANHPEIAGHLHPVAKIRAKGRSIRRKCFISNSNRCILPAFGAFTGGLNILDTAFGPLFPGQNFLTHMISANQIFAIGRHSLVKD